MNKQSFDLYPQCPKCLSMSVRKEHQTEHQWRRDCLELVCQTCGFLWHMETADSQEKKNKELLMEEKEEVFGSDELF